MNELIKLRIENRIKFDAISVGWNNKNSKIK